MLELNKSNFEKETSSGMVVIDNWAEWCAPCRAMSPIFEALSKEMKDIKFAKLNVDENPEIASRYSVMSIPTFLILKDGKEVDRIIGAMPKERIKEKISAAVKK